MMKQVFMLGKFSVRYGSPLCHAHIREKWVKRLSHLIYFQLLDVLIVFYSCILSLHLDIDAIIDKLKELLTH